MHLMPSLLPQRKEKIAASAPAGTPRRPAGQAIHGVGIDWTFAGEAVEHGGFLVRAAAVGVSLGGLLVTALMLGIVSGRRRPSVLFAIKP